jgi:hypothetical protein
MNYLSPSTPTTPTTETTSMDPINNDRVGEGEAYLPPLLEKENIIWSRRNTKGIFHKRTTKREWITNYRIVKCDPYIQELYLSSIQDTAVINQTHVSTSTYSGISSGGRGSRFVSGSSNSQGSVIGDPFFLVQGKPIIIFERVNDPQNLVKYIKLLMMNQQHKIE